VGSELYSINIQIMERIFKFIPILVLFILMGCSGEEVAGEDLTGGNWVATAGFLDGTAEGEPNCYPFEEGIEFNGEDTVYVETFERDFEFWLSEDEGPPTKLFFRDDSTGLYRYEITVLSENEMGLTGIGQFEEGRSCYLERE
jgi:hypothetical protein